MMLQETQALEVGPTCCHHWMIEPADGPVSLGFCRLCFESREFKNSIEEAWNNSDLPEKVAVPALSE